MKLPEDMSEIDVPAVLQHLKLKLSNVRTFEEANKIYFSIIQYLLIPTIQLHKEDFLKLSIYRARILKPEENIADVNTFGSAKIASSIQRANWPGHPVFYGADRAYTSIQETIRSTEVESFYIGQWQLAPEKFNATFINVYPLLMGHLSTDNPWRVLGTGYEELIKKMNRANSKESVENFKKLLRGLCEIFTEESDKSYSASAFIAHSYIYNSNSQITNNQHPILIYPAVKNHASCNFAIHPDFVNRNMYANKFVHIKNIGVQKSENRISAEVSKFGISNNHKLINWYLPELEWQTMRFQISNVSDSALLKQKNSSDEINLNDHLEALINYVKNQSEQIRLNTEKKLSIFLSDVLDNFQFEPTFITSHQIEIPLTVININNSASFCISIRTAVNFKQI